MTGTAMGLWVMLGTVAAAQPGRAGADDRLDRDAMLVAEWVADAVERIEAEYVKPVNANALLLAALEEMYAAAGNKLPAHFRTKAAAAATPEERMRVVYQARLALGPVDPLDGMRAVAVAAAGFGKLTDPYCGLSVSRAGFIAGSDSEYGLGFELDGATGNPWLAYQLDFLFSLRGGRAGADGFTPPASFPWTISRVIPGSPAAAAGLRPGDTIARLDDAAVTVKSSPGLFRKLATAIEPGAWDPALNPPASRPVKVTVARPGVPGSMTHTLPRGRYYPESVAGAARRADGTWDFMLDKAAKIGYIRVGSVEIEADTAFRSAVGSLVRDGANGLILDLRWCPGGYVVQTARIASSLLPPGKVVAKIQYRDPARATEKDPTSEPGDHPAEWDRLPLAVLVGPDTVGGGEMIAAALQDHGRGLIVGQRTFGKATISTLTATRLQSLNYRITTAYSLRPDGRQRHRFPDSKPTDDWGVRPDPGCTIPITPDLSAKLRQQAERQAIRPPSDRDAVEYDDPLADPQRLIAVKLLIERMKE